MGTRKIKKQILHILNSAGIQEISEQLSLFPEKETINALFSSLCSANEIVRWYGISAMGLTIARLADKNIEDARIIMRRLLWSLNDESGGIGWGAPESMAEAMYRHETLANEYIHMLVSYTQEDGEEEWQDGNYLEHGILQRGLLWGVGRLGEKRKSALIKCGIRDTLPPYLLSSDHSIRGLAAWTLGMVGNSQSANLLEHLLEDNTTVTIYENDDLTLYRVQDLAHQAIERLLNKRLTL